MAERTWTQSSNGHEVARSLLSPKPNGKFDLIDGNNGLPISLADGSNIGSFSRLRVSNPAMVWESKLLYGKDAHSFEEVISGAGSSSTYRTNESSVRLTCGTGATDSVIRQTKKYFPYVAGHGQINFITFNMIAQPTANCVKRVGRYDSEDGLFLEWNNTDIRVVARTSTSGTAVDTAYASQADWNIDTLDGSGKDSNPSGITLDLTKTHILVTDYQWLGVGRVRFGFDIGGQIIYVHEFNHANADTIVYMRTPNLPLRYEVTNTDVTTAVNTMDCICSSIVSEGGIEPSGHNYAVSTGLTSVTAASGTRTPILAIRQSTTFNGKTNRRIALASTLEFLAETNNIYYEITQYPEPDITITGGWVDLDADHSSIQYAIGSNITVNSEVGAHPFKKGYLIASAGLLSESPGSGGADIQIRTHHNEMLVNYDGSDCETIVVWAAGLGGSASVRCSANCIEYS